MMGQDWDCLRKRNPSESANLLKWLATPPRLERGTYCLEGSYRSPGESSSNISILVQQFPNPVQTVWDYIGTEHFPAPIPRRPDAQTNRPAVGGGPTCKTHHHLDLEQRHDFISEVLVGSRPVSFGLPSRQRSRFLSRTVTRNTDRNCAGFGSPLSKAGIGQKWNSRFEPRLSRQRTQDRTLRRTRQEISAMTCIRREQQHGETYHRRQMVDRSA